MIESSYEGEPYTSFHDRKFLEKFKKKENNYVIRFFNLFIEYCLSNVYIGKHVRPVKKNKEIYG